MIRYGYVGQAVVSTCVALLVSACAALGGTPVAPETGQSQLSETKQPTVFGKFDLLRDGKEVKISGMAWLGVDAFSVLVLPEGANRALVLGTDKQGWFAWKLKPGTYALQAFSFSSSSRESKVGELRSHFTVGESDATVYVGHITIDIGGTRRNVGFRDSEQEAAQEFEKRNPQAQAPTKRLLERDAVVGTYRSIQSVCAKEWGVECSRDLQGVEPISPELIRGRGPTFTKVGDTLPDLSWKLPLAPGVSYDVGIWEAAAYRLPSLTSVRYIRGQLVVYEEDLSTSTLTLKAPLKSNTKYFWSVRLRKGDVVSSWSQTGYFTFLVVAWSSSSGGWFGFETP